MLAANRDGKESQPSTSSSIESSQPCRQFEFDEILLATHDFDESLVIGHGGFGKVYKGNIINGLSAAVAAIKRLDSLSSQGAAEFWAEVEMLSKLRHCHLVSLFGYCNYKNEMILIYEYMPNGTLEDHLHKLGTPLSWLQRLKICIGAGRGLHYLHTGTGIEIGVIHRDVKSSNILLRESWAAKISDFGLSKIGPTNQPSTYVNTHVKGTFGYLDPDYAFTGRLTRKSDVYAFGVVLLEVLCRKPALDRSVGEEPRNLARWAQESIKEGNLKHIIDSGIKGEISPKCLKKFVGIAEMCLHSNPKQRPTMAEVVVALESVVALQEKTISSVQAVGKTIFGRMFDMFLFPSNKNNPEQQPAMDEFVISLDSVVTSNQAVESKDSVSPQEDYHRMTMERASEARVDGKYPLASYVNHKKTVTIKNGVNVKKETLNIEADEENPGKFIVSFTFDASVPCNITLYFFAIEGEDCNVTTIKEDSHPPLTLSFQQGLGQKFKQTPGTGIDLSMYDEAELCKKNETGVYPLAVKAEATHEDQNPCSSVVKSQLTNAVFENDKGEYKVRVVEQILWVNGLRYVMDGGDIFEPISVVAAVEDEWSEVYEPGVIITVLALCDGTRDLKKVGFSSSYFGKHEAETWWSENREKVYERYKIRGWSKSSVYSAMLPP